MALCLLAQATSMAQPGGRGGAGGRGGFGGFGGGGQRGGGLTQLVMNEAIQKEIELEDFQLEGIELAMEELERPQLDFRGLRELDEDERREKMTEFRETMTEFSKKQEEAIADVLSEDQIKRVREIEVQIAGVRAVQIPRVEEELDLTKTQKEKVQDCLLYTSPSPRDP